MEFGRSALSQRGGAIPSCSPHPHAGRQRQARGAAPGRRPVAGDAHPGPGAVPVRGAPRFRVLRAALTRRRNRPAADGPAASPWARKQRLVAAGTSRQDAARSWPPGAASSKGSEHRPPGRRQRSPVSMASVTHGPNAKWKAPETNNTYALTPF